MNKKTKITLISSIISIAVIAAIIVPVSISFTNRNDTFSSDTFEKYDGWVKLVTEYEKYWTENCPYTITIGKLNQFDANYQNRTVTYGVNVSYENSIKYQVISEIVKTGFDNSYRSDWKKIPEEWPTESVYMTNDGKYLHDGVALVNIGGKNYPAALIAIGEEEQLFYDIKFIVTDLDGNKLLESGRKLIGSQGAVLFKNVYEITMKKIESGEIKIVPTGIYLEYGKITTAERAWVKNLPEIAINEKNIIIKTAYDKYQIIETPQLVEKIAALVQKEDKLREEKNKAELLAQAEKNEQLRKAQEELAKKKEEERLAAEAKKKEEERLAAEAKRKEEERLAAEAKRKEEERLAAEAKRKEEERLAAEAKRIEQEKLAAEAKRKEEERLAAEAKRKEQERISAEIKKREAERLAAEAKRKEEERIAAEAKKKEEERLAAEAKKKEEERIAAEAKKKEQERLVAEAKKREEERLAAEAKRIEQEKLAAEAKRKEEERLKEIQQKKAMQEKLLHNQEVVKNTKSDMITVESGNFKMGGIEQYKVTLSKYYISKTEVTQELYEIVMGKNPSNFKGVQKPVDSVSWFDAIVFCNKLSILCDLTPCYSVDGEINPDKWNYVPGKGAEISGKIECNFIASGFRLPTEAEWEYAARGGDKKSKYNFSGANKVTEVARYNDNSSNKTGDVAEKKPNAIGLYDMSGNVWEWCWDWYSNYQIQNKTNPLGADSGVGRCIRGGSYCRGEAENQVLFRELDVPQTQSAEIGFRLVRTAD